MPLTETEEALALDQEIVVEPGAVALLGLALIDAVTAGGAAMVTVCVIVAEVAPFQSNDCAVNVTVRGPVSLVVFPELFANPSPPPPNANGTPSFHTRTSARFPSESVPRAVTV